MRAILRILAAAATTASAAVLSACAFLPSHRDPERIEIGGESYVSGFYENLWPDGIVFDEDDPPAFETEYHLWWEVASAPFSLYCAQNKEALYWNPTIYCKESESEEIGAYYADAGNFDYYIGLYGDSNENERIRLEANANTALLEKAISLNTRIQENEGKGLLNGREDFSDIEISIPYAKVLPVQPVFYRMSKDGFFTTEQNDWLVADGKVSVFGSYDADTDMYTAYIIDEEASAYMLGLLGEYGLL